jgi:hypothetical protein
MFRENKDHLQSKLIGTLSDLPDGMLAILEQSWAGTFRQEIFMRLDENLLAGLYSDKASRPNVPVNVLLGLEIMKAGFGWTDEELYQSFTFDLQVRYALGYEQLGEGYFSVRTLYIFRQRLREHMEQSGENLLEQVFAQITDEQRHALSVKSDKLRMDSTQIASNIYRYGRIELLVEILQRVHRMLSESDRQRLDELLASYLETDGHSYTYRMQNKETGAKLDEIGHVMATLVTELAVDYASEGAYEQLVRVFHDHFRLSDGDIEPIPAAEIKVTALQSPDDPEATFHRKREEGHRGYAAHVTETCNPNNPLQLIVDVRTEPNAVDDAKMLITVLPEVAQRMAVDELYTDGGYNSPKVDPVLTATSVRHNQTALRGVHTKPTSIGMAAFDIQTDATGYPSRLTCPMGQAMDVKHTKRGNLVARPNHEQCMACPLLDRCPAHPRADGKSANYYFGLRQIQVALKRHAIEARPSGQMNLRNAVESTIRSIKNPFRHGKVLVRGKFRVASMVIGSALMVNLRRIHRLQTQCAGPCPDNDTI